MSPEWVIDVVKSSRNEQKVRVIPSRVIPETPVNPLG